MKAVLRSILLAMLLFGSATADAEEGVSAISGLSYREALFQHHAGRPFLALTHLLMASSRGRTTGEAQALLAELYLEYGLHTRAERILASPDVVRDRTVPGRAWLVMGTAAYHHGDPALAEHALALARKDESVKDQAGLALAEIRLDQGRDEEAARLLSDWQGTDDLMPYARYNLAVALRRMKQKVEANEVLERVGRIEVTDTERRHLRDRANLALALSLLDDGQAASAQRALDRIHLDGPLASHALLAAGRAEMALGRPDAAQAAWARLARGDRHDPAVLHALILLAELTRERGRIAQADRLYREALARLRESGQVVNDGMERIRQGLLPHLSESGRIIFPEQDSMRPVHALLAGLFASSGFHHQLVHLRELENMQVNLEYWRDNLPIYRHLVDSHEQRRARYLERAYGLLDEAAFPALTTRARRLADRLHDARKDTTGLLLLTPAERVQWRALDDIRQRLATLPEGTRGKGALQQKAERLRGLLLWRAGTRYPARRWNAEKQAAGLRVASEDLAARQQGLGQAIDSSTRRFTGQDRRIDTLSGRVAALLDRSRETRLQVQSSLKRLALQGLARQRQELEMLTIQARYALARLHDARAVDDDNEARP